TRALGHRSGAARNPRRTASSSSLPITPTGACVAISAIDARRPRAEKEEGPGAVCAGWRTTAAPQRHGQRAPPLERFMSFQVQNPRAEALRRVRLCARVCAPYRGERTLDRSTDV